MNAAFTLELHWARRTSWRIVGTVNITVRAVALAMAHGGGGPAAAARAAAAEGRLVHAPVHASSAKGVMTVRCRSLVAVDASGAWTPWFGVLRLLGRLRCREQQANDPHQRLSQHTAEFGPSSTHALWLAS